MILCELPPLVLWKVVRYLDVPSLSKTSKTSRYLYQVIMGNRHELPRPQLILMLFDEFHCHSKKLQLSVKNHSGQRRWFSILQLSDRQEMEEEDIKSETHICFHTTFHFTSIEQLEIGVAEALAYFLERADLEDCSISDMDETALEQIANVFRANKRCRVHRLRITQNVPLSSSSLCQFIRTIHGVQKYNLFVTPAILSEELLKIPQICEATEEVFVKYIYNSRRQSRLPLTDSDVLALSAKRIKLGFLCGITANFLRTFVQEFLSKKREIDNPARYETFNFFKVDLPDLKLEEIFGGMGFHRNSSKRGFFKRDDDEMLEYQWISNTFYYRLRKNGEKNLKALLNNIGASS